MVIEDDDDDDDDATAAVKERPQTVKQALKIVTVTQPPLKRTKELKRKVMHTDAHGKITTEWITDLVTDDE